MRSQLPWFLQLWAPLQLSLQLVHEVPIFTFGSHQVPRTQNCFCLPEQLAHCHRRPMAALAPVSAPVIMICQLGCDRRNAACYLVELLGYSRPMHLNHPARLAFYSLRKRNRLQKRNLFQSLVASCSLRKPTQYQWREEAQTIAFSRATRTCRELIRCLDDLRARLFDCDAWPH